MNRWTRRWSALSALALLVLVGLAPPAAAHVTAYGDAEHIHEATFAPRDTRCGTLLSGAESVSSPGDPSGVTSPTSPDVNDPVWGQNAQIFGPGGSTSQPSPLGTPGAANAVDHHWVHDDTRVAGTLDPLVFDFGAPVLTVDYYPFVDHPEDATLRDPFSGRLFGSNDPDPDVVGDTPLDLVVVWDEGWDTANPLTYIDDFVQRYVSTTGPVRYIKVLTDPAVWPDTEVDAVCTPEAPPGNGGGTPGEPAPGGEGCTPGFWKQAQHSNAWIGTGFTQDQSFETVFGVPDAFPGPGPTLFEALGLGGGGMNALARHAVAALLNSAGSDIDYAFTTADVIAMVQNAVATGDLETAKNALAAENEAGCPINGKSPQG